MKICRFYGPGSQGAHQSNYLFNYAQLFTPCQKSQAKRLKGLTQAQAGEGGFDDLTIATLRHLWRVSRK